MKKLLLLLPLLLLTLSATAQNQPTGKRQDVKPIRDSIRFDTSEVKTLYRNQQIFQQFMHKIEISALLRDRLDSVYNQSAVLFEKKLRGKKDEYDAYK